MDYDEISGPSGGHVRGARPDGTRRATPAYPSRGTATPSSGTAGTAEPRAPRPLMDLNPEHERWLLARGLDSDVIASCGVVSAEVPNGGEWIAIPYRVGDKVVNWKFRCLNEKRFAQVKGAKQTWWNADAITDPTLADQPLIVTEGELDAMAAMSAGFVRVVSVPGGAPMQPTESDGKYAYLADSLDALRNCREVVIAADNDEPGHALLQDLATRFGKGRCKYVVYPEGCKDLNDVLLGYERSGVVAAINAARWVKVTGLCRMSELPPVPDVMGLAPHIPGLAKHFRPRKGDFAVVTGIPNCGKSTFINELACGMAHAHKWNTCFASFEQHPQVDHRRALRTWWKNGPEHTMTPEERVKADLWIDRYFSFVIPDDEADADLDWLIERLSAAVIRYGADMAVIDPWNELDHAKPSDMTMTEYVGTAIRKLKRFAARMNVFLVVVAHPSKMARDRDGKTPIPTLYDVSDSAHWFNKTDLGLVIHPAQHEDGGPMTILRVVKSRYHDRIGEPGEVRLFFNRDTAKYEGID